MQNMQDSYFPLYSIWKLSEVFPLRFYISIWLGTSTRIFKIYFVYSTSEEVLLK